MLIRALLIVGAVAIAAVPAACGGEGFKPTYTPLLQPGVYPSPTLPAATAQPATDVPPALPTAGRPLPVSSDNLPSPVRGVSVSHLVNPAPTLAPTPMASTIALPTLAPTILAASPSGSAEEADVIRELARMYWETFNAYDADHVLSMLEPSYRAEEDELIRGDIGRMRLFRVQLDVSEKSSPALNEDGEYVTYMNLETPIDSRTVKMVFRHIGGHWWIVYSDEVE